MPTPIGPPARVIAPAGATVKTRTPEATVTVREARFGSTTNFVVFAPPGEQAASEILKAAEIDYAAIQRWFRGIAPPGLPFTVHVDPDAGGAYHMSCGETEIHVVPLSGQAAGFVAAVVTEVFEATLANGWDCGLVNGEALSRVLAFELHPEVIATFQGIEAQWWDGGHPDFVNDRRATDLNLPAIGCGQLFLYYLRHQLQFSWDAIVAAGGRTMGETYQHLTGKDGKLGFAAFLALLKTIELGRSLQVPRSGNPFPLSVK